MYTILTDGGSFFKGAGQNHVSPLKKVNHYLIGSHKLMMGFLFPTTMKHTQSMPVSVPVKPVALLSMLHVIKSTNGLVAESGIQVTVILVGMTKLFLV